MATIAETSARERLLGTAIERFAESGVVGVTLEQIRREAGVSTGALYHHFADKEALLDAVYVRLLAAFQAEFVSALRGNADAEQGVKAGVRCYLRWVAANRSEASILLAHRPDTPELTELNRAFFAEVRSWWATHVHYGSLRELPFDLLPALWLGPAQEYTRQWLAGRARRVPPSVSELLGESAWQVLKEQR